MWHGDTAGVGGTRGHACTWLGDRRMTTSRMKSAVLTAGGGGWPSAVKCAAARRAGPENTMRPVPLRRRRCVSIWKMSRRGWWMESAMVTPEQDSAARTSTTRFADVESRPARRAHVAGAHVAGAHSGPRPGTAHDCASGCALPEQRCAQSGACSQNRQGGTCKHACVLWPLRPVGRTAARCVGGPYMQAAPGNEGLTVAASVRLRREVGCRA